MLNNKATTDLLTRVCLMESSGARAVKAAYVQLNEYLNLKPLEPHQIQAYSRDLSDYPPHLVVRALEEMRQVPGRRFLPLPWEVIAFLSPQASEDNAAGEIAAQIVACIASCGRTQPARARRKLGPMGWAVVGTLGGWEQLCQTLRTDEINTFRAQARGVAKAEIERQSQRQRRALLEGRMPTLLGGPEQAQPLAPPPDRARIDSLVQALAAQKAQGVR